MVSIREIKDRLFMNNSNFSF